MCLNDKHYLLLVCYLYATLWQCAGKVSYYMVTERPAITYVNSTYLPYANVTSRRHGRGNPIYYVDAHLTSLVAVDNTYKVDYYFYEFLSNEYKRGFVEMHFSVCDVIEKDKFLGVIFRQGKLQRCPILPGDYHIHNLSIPSMAIPAGFPFTKGRIYANITHRGVYVACGHIDMELKEKLIRPGRA